MVDWGRPSRIPWSSTACPIRMPTQPARPTSARPAAIRDAHGARRTVTAASPTSPGREREVLALLRRGLTNAEICDALVVSLPTAKTHVANVLAKLDLRDRVQAAIFAQQNRV